MAETISVRIPGKSLKEIDQISKQEKMSKSEVLRSVVEIGIRTKRLEIAIEKYRNEEVTAWKAARLAEVPLTKFLDILAERNIIYNYSVDDLEAEIEEL